LCLDVISLKKYGITSTKNLLQSAIEAYDLHRKENRQARSIRLEIIISLIHHGCSLFSLPLFHSNEQPIYKNSIVRPTKISWRILIAALEALICLTPTGEQVRQSLLHYSEIALAQNVGGTFDFYGKRRSAEVLKIMMLLFKSQQPESLGEDTLLLQIKDYAQTAPRGWKKRSRLYTLLQDIIQRTETRELMVIPEHKTVQMGSKINPSSAVMGSSPTFFANNRSLLLTNTSHASRQSGSNPTFRASTVSSSQGADEMAIGESNKLSRRQSH
jgi:hypothetical protein